MGSGRQLRTIISKLFATLGTLTVLSACTNGNPQVEFLKLLTGEVLFPGVILKINGATTTLGNVAAPAIDISGFSDASKVEVFTTSTCDTNSKVGEVSVLATDVSTSLTPPALTTDGVYTYYAMITSQTGVVSDCSKNRVIYTYDNTPPAAPSAIILVTAAHNTATPVLQVRGVEVGASTTLYSDASCTIAASGASGVATSTNVNVTSSAVVEGSYNYYAKVQDAAGNSSACTSSFANYVYDITPPAMPTNVTFTSGTTSPSNNANPSFDVDGLVAGDVVKVYGDAQCLMEISSATVTTSLMSITTMPALSADGTYQIHATAVDAYGNTSACSSSSVTYVFDKTAPAKASTLALKIPATSPGNNANPTITVNGVETNDVVTLYRDATCSVLIASGTATGSSIDLMSGSLPSDGTYEFYAHSMDAAGNGSGCSTAKVTYVFDATAPNKPTSLSLANPASNPSNITLPSFNVGSSFVVGDIVKLYSDASCSTAASAMTTVSTAGSVTIPLSTTLSTSGTYTYYARAFDLAGNVSLCSSASVDYVFDNVAPAAPTSIALTTPSTSPGNITTPTLTVSGVTSGDVVQIFSNAACSSFVKSQTAAGGTAAIVLPTLTEGSYTFYANAKDAAGNVSSCTSTSANYTLDITPPATPSSLTLVSPGSSPGKLSSPLLQVNGVTSGDLIGLYLDASCTTFSGSVSASGNTAVISAATLPSAGNYIFYAMATDAAGNNSGCSPGTNYTFDNISPTVSTVTSTNPDRTYGTASAISITLNMSEVVNVNTTGGVPTLTLNTSPTRVATYSSGSGSNQLVFTYTVQLGDTSLDLDYASTTSLALNGSLVTDIAGNNLSSTMSAPGSTASLTYNRSIVISPNPPMASLQGAPTVLLNEGGTAQTVQISLNFPSAFDMTVHLMSYGNALIGVDYMLSNSLVTIPAGSTSTSVTFTPLENAIVDIPRRLMLFIDSVDGLYPSSLNKISQKEFYIIDNDQTQLAPQNLAKSSVGNHTCAIKSDGTLRCWGANNSGQLGDNTTANNKSTPMTPSGLTGNVLKAATGGSHTCAIKTDNSLWCWGNGSSGQLGIGSVATKIVPNQVGTGYVKIAAGNTHTCAIKTDNSLWCWGGGSLGQIGIGSIISTQISPTQVSGGDTYLDVFAGGNHTCAISTSNILKCWGANSYGESAGSGSTSSYITSPAVVDSGVSYTSAGLGANHTCAVTTTGVLKCWGLNSSGQVGDDTLTDRPSALVVIPSNVSQVVAGNAHTCATLTNGDLQCWGGNNFGQLGNGNSNGFKLPQLIHNNTTSISAGSNHSCLITSDGNLKCWGQNTYSQHGTDKEDTVKSMSLVEAAMASIAQSDLHACGLTTSGGVRCWGANTFGQIGDGTTISRSSPIQIINSGVAQVATGSMGSCAVFTNGKLQCWGYNTNGRLGDGTSVNRLRPVDIIPSGVASVSMGADFTCALMTDSSVKCWGANGSLGKVGNGSTGNQLTPVTVVASGATQVVLGANHACALVSSKVHCWGENIYGQFGTPTPTTSNTPFNTGNTMDTLGAGSNHTCGIYGGDLFCWGQNSYYQIGDNTNVNRTTPTQIDLGVAYTQIAGSTYHTCGVTSGGIMKCWGNNSNTQMGAAGSTNSPTTIVPSNVSKVSVGVYASCAIDTFNFLRCVGVNSSGQLGLGNLGILNLPLDVYGL